MEESQRRAALFQMVAPSHGTILQWGIELGDMYYKGYLRVHKESSTSRGGRLSKEWETIRSYVSLRFGAFDELRIRIE